MWAVKADPGLKQGWRYTKIVLILATSGYGINKDGFWTV